MPGRVFDLVYEASELLLNWCPAIDDPPFKKRNERRLLRSNPQLFAEVRSITMRSTVEYCHACLCRLGCAACMMEREQDTTATMDAPSAI